MNEVTSVVDKNIRALLSRRQVEERAKGWDERVADAISRFAGSIKFVWLHLVIYGVWIGINLPWSPAWLRFDPTFVVLAMEASVEAIFLSTFILITQNRMQAIANERSDLDLQISLLAEHEITRLLVLVQRMSEQLGVKESGDPELEELQKDVEPEKVLDQILKVEKETGVSS
jgi:uncharacterized membrane protein